MLLAGTVCEPAASMMMTMVRSDATARRWKRSNSRRVFTRLPLASAPRHDVRSLRQHPPLPIRLLHGLEGIGGGAGRPAGSHALFDALLNTILHTTARAAATGALLLLWRGLGWRRALQQLLNHNGLMPRKRRVLRQKWRSCLQGGRRLATGQA